MDSKSLLNLKDTHNVFWLVTLEDKKIHPSTLWTDNMMMVKTQFYLKHQQLQLWGLKYSHLTGICK